MKDFRHEQYWYIKRHNFLHDLSKTDADALSTITKFKKLKHGEHISQQGVYLIKEGRIKISENPSDIKSVKLEKQPDSSDIEMDGQTTEVLEQGEIFGVLDDKDEHFSIDLKPHFLAETLTEVCLGAITIRDFKFFLKRKPHLVLPLQKKLNYSKELREFNLHYFGKSNFIKKSIAFSNNNLFSVFNVKSKHTNALSNIAFRCVTSRLALLLQNLALSPNSKGVVFTHRVLKNQIAKLIGSSTETIEKQIKILSEHKVVDLHKGKIQITNLWKLKKIADARMKTLLSPKASTNTQGYEYDLQTMTNLQEEIKSESNNTHTST